MKPGALLVVKACHFEDLYRGIRNPHWVVSEETSMCKNTAFIVLEIRDHSCYWHEFMTDRGILYVKRKRA